MDSGRYKKRMNVEGDRLSNLPDDLIHKILSFIDFKQAIETSGLSSRWRYICTSMPSLSFSSKDFHSQTKFSKFVTHVLSRRNNQTEVSYVNLTFHGKISEAFVKRILNTIFNYDFTNNVQQLNITFSSKRSFISPLSLFGSQSIKHFTFAGSGYTPTWDLPNLTTLNLYDVTFRVGNSDGLFSIFANLKNLTLKKCGMLGSTGFHIRHPSLSNLILEDGYEDVNVVTPQLKNLTIKYWRGINLVSAPYIASLQYKGYYCSLPLSVDLLHLEKVDICISSQDKADARKFVHLLQQLHSVKFLTLNLEIIKLLSSFVELISHQPSPFANLKCLKIYPVYNKMEYPRQPIAAMSTEVKNYLLGGSPGATFTMVSHEEIRAVVNVTSARNLMVKLQVLLDKWKGSSVTNTTQMKQDKASMHEQVEDESTQLNTIMKFHIRKRMECIREQLKKGYKNTDRAISMLHEIEKVMTKLPASDQAKLQARYSSLYKEAETIMVDNLKIQC